MVFDLKVSEWPGKSGPVLMIVNRVIYPIKQQRIISVAGWFPG